MLDYAAVMWILIQSGELIPALVLDSELICNYVVEPERINACFGDGPNPV